VLHVSRPCLTAVRATPDEASCRGAMHTLCSVLSRACRMLSSSNHYYRCRGAAV
jgi:hypothetical protein